MHTYKVHVKEKTTMSFNELNDKIEQIFDKAIDEVDEQCGSEYARGKVVIHTAGLEPIIVPLQPYKDLNGALVTETVNNVLESHQEVVLDSDDFEITISAIRLPSGSGFVPYNNPQCAYIKESVCEVTDNSVSCLSQAIAIAFAKASVVKNAPKSAHGKKNETLIATGKCSLSHYNNVLKKTRNEKLDLAKMLCTRTGVSVKGELSIVDIPKFENLLCCNIVAISSEYNLQVVYPGCGKYEKQLFILHTLNAEGKGHFHAISDVCKFYGQGCYCFPCLKPFKKGQHRCSYYCHLCESFVCKPGEPWTCNECNFTFQSTDCFERHLQVPDDDKYKGKNKGLHEDDKLSRCDRIKKCTECKAILFQTKRTLKQHVCFEKFCKFCKTYVLDEHHLCYQRVEDVSDTPQKLLFFDAETSTSEETVQCKAGFKPDAETAKCTNCNQLSCGQKRHTPVLIVSETACGFCQDKDVNDTSTCNNCGSRCSNCNKMRKGKFEKRPCPSTCGLRRKVFYGKCASNDFYTFLVAKEHTNFTVMAHNGSKFDNYFLLQEALTHGGKPKNISFRGSKMIFMQLPYNIMCIDSYSFLPFPLAKFKDTLELDSGCSKFDFPYDFIKFDNLDYVGPWPSLEQYSANRYDTDEFREWHAEQKDKLFDFKAELTSYCIQDVAILRKGALKFQQLIHDLTVEKDKEENVLVPGVLAFSKPTLASLAMLVFKTKFLWETRIVKNSQGKEMTARYKGGQYYIQNEDEQWILAKEPLIFDRFVDSPIAACPNDNYLQKDNFSQVSMKWLMWKQQQLGVPVQTALSPEGEKKVPTTSKVTYRLDGYVAPEYNNDKPLALEFLGCRYHGHGTSDQCDHQYVKDSEAWKSAKELYSRTLFKLENLRQQGYDVEAIWECDYHRQLADNPEMKTYIDSVQISERLNIRDGIYGGRVSPVTLMAEAVGGNDKIHFADFCSLYPSQMRDETFMVGHPKIVRNLDPDQVPNLFGYVYCRILPPTNLYFPVLPTRIDDKLLFVLCRSCGASKQTACTHTDEERCLEGVYTSNELHRAVELGYVVQEVYEAWHWEKTTKYKKGKDFTGLFAGYVNLFLKVKTEASGWPAGVETQEQKEAYVQDFFDREGIKLDPDNIQYNPAMRTIAKLVST
jgi:hypothetical protein